MDQFQEKAKKGLDFIKSRAMETVEVQKLTSQLRAMERRKEECILDLGHRVFVMFEMDRFDPESLKDRVDEVRRLNGEIEEKQREVRELREQFKHSVEEIIPGRQRPGAEVPAQEPFPPDPEAPAAAEPEAWSEPEAPTEETFPEDDKA